MRPFLIELSLRENPVGTRAGQSLSDKISLLPLIRQFGFQNILLGTLDYADPTSSRSTSSRTITTLRGGFAFIDIGSDPGTGFQPSRLMQKLADYHVSNTLLEIYLAVLPYTFEQLMSWLPQSIAWLRASGSLARSRRS